MVTWQEWTYFTIVVSLFFWSMYMDTPSGGTLFVWMNLCPKNMGHLVADGNLTRRSIAFIIIVTSHLLDFIRKTHPSIKFLKFNMEPDFRSPWNGMFSFWKPIIFRFQPLNFGGSTGTLLHLEVQKVAVALVALSLVLERIRMPRCHSARFGRRCFSHFGQRVPHTFRNSPKGNYPLVFIQKILNIHHTYILVGKTWCAQVFFLWTYISWNKTGQV